MLKLKSKLIVAVMLMLGITAFMSCEKEGVVESENLEVKIPVDNFKINFNSDGTFTSNDAIFIESYPQMKIAFENISKSIKKKKSSGNTSFTIGSDGIIISNDPYYNGKSINDILFKEGVFTYFKEDLEIFFNSDGFLKVSNPAIFEQFPFLVDYLNMEGEKLKTKIPENETVILSITKTGDIFVNNSSIFSNNKEYDCDYDDFKACVGDWWFVPGVNVIACGIGCGIVNVF